MRLLLIHTGGSEGTVALAEEGRIVAVEVLPGRTSSELLLPAVRRLMAECGWRVRELAAIGVVSGPGSFTGVRVGLSAAKGLSEAGEVPLVAVSRLGLLAAKVGKGDGLVHAVLDAGRGEFYYGRYLGWERVEELLVKAEDLVGLVEGGVVIVCEPKVAAALEGMGPMEVEEPVAGDLLPLVKERVAKREFDDAVTLDANYLREMDAEILARMRLGRAAG